MPKYYGCEEIEPEESYNLDYFKDMIIDGSKTELILEENQKMKSTTEKW